MLDVTDLAASVSFISAGIESQDRKKRKKVIDSLNVLLGDNNEFLRVFESVRNLVWGCVSDPAEVVRDAVLDLLQNLVRDTSVCDEYVGELMPVLLYQLQEHEPSEEIRLKLIQLLGLVQNRCGLDAYCVEIIDTLKICLEDKYPAVRQEAAKCCVLLSKTEGSLLYDNCVKLVLPIIACVKHKHSKTRVLAVEALCAVLKNANWKNINAQLVFGLLGETLFDEHLGVRLAIVDLLGHWLIQLRDRYSFFSRMVPLILSCLGDEHPEVSRRAWTVWNKAGTQYVNENESDLKNKLDFLNQMPAHYPDGVERPNLGCRVLVQRNLVQITTPLVKELTDWQAAVCVKASGLLAMVVLHAEAELTQHTSGILLAMYGIADNNSEDVVPQFRENIEKAAEYIGYFIKPSTWHLLVFPLLETEPTSGKFFILAALLRASAPGILHPYSETLSRILSNDSVCQTLNPKMQLEVLKTCRAFMDNVDEIPENAQKNFLRCLLYITAIASYKPEKTLLADAGTDCVESLAVKSKSTRDKLIRKFLKRFLEDLQRNVANWSTTHADFRLLIFVMRETDWCDEEEIVFDILKMVEKDGDVEVRSRVFETLAHGFSQRRDSKFAVKIVNELVVPGLVWKAGMSAERLRTVVLACLVSVAPFVDDGVQYAELLPVLFGCVRDPPRLSRKLAQEGIGFVVRLAKGTMNPQLVNEIFPKVVERLDDVEDDVRCAAVDNLQKLFSCLPGEMQENTHSGAFAYFVKTMLPYLDDDIEAVRLGVHDALKILSTRAPKIVQSTVKPKAHLFKNEELCKELLAAIPSISE